MLHPDLKLKNSKIHGKGLFAVKKIPKGTIVWRLGDNDRKFSISQYSKLSSKYRKRFNRYAYKQDNHTYIYCTDNSKYWNHSCNPNASYVVDFNMDIAIKDINQGEEITYDYSVILINGEELVCHCGKLDCRQRINGKNQIKIIENRLEKESINAIKCLNKVPQPLLYSSDPCPCGSKKKYAQCHGK